MCPNSKRTIWCLVNVSNLTNDKDGTHAVGSAIINNETIENISGVRLNAESLYISLIRNTSSIDIYTFKSFMLPIESKRKGIERYVFSGPRLGVYCEVADPREGSFVNHFIEEMDINIEYLDKSALFSIKGMADISKSSFDSYWYKGETSGPWKFQISFSHKF